MLLLATLCRSVCQHMLLDMQTLSHLHLKARTAHLDISSRNIMFLQDAQGFDEIRLLDFGLSQKCTCKPYLHFCGPTFVLLAKAPKRNRSHMF